jgi:hypothetical protein
MNAPGIVALFAVFDQHSALRDATGTNKACSVGEFELFATGSDACVLAEKEYVVTTKSLACRWWIPMIKAIYICRCHREKDGKRHAYWRWSKAIAPGGPRQRVVA